MKKPTSLWIVQFFIVCSILMLIYTFSISYRELLTLHDANIPEHVKINIYFWSFIELLIFVIQILGLYFSFKRNMLAKLFTILGWLPVCFMLMYVEIITSVGKSYQIAPITVFIILSKCIIVILLVWLTAIILFSKKIKSYFQFN